ncbi:Retrovirus-related Pol polyprotein from transposon TNT 1-94 [Dendrobium catenatum]|uniref:Retrovirus-related Pol polyprotein from transposon TNT 1-94 n=1 Tax=Dendrobium catenatum TaxID=906689 RepID=A0A2I0VWK0_9ASPA|nr:Retrovirus-related Pol polyprotein from transposon TNT 1-94 [Dendrobium catenatum]
MQIEYLLYQKLHLPLEGITKRPNSMTMEKWDVLDRIALCLIRLSHFSYVAFNIVNKKATVDFMVALTKMYEKPSASNKVFLMKKVIQYEDVRQHFNDRAHK